MTTFSPYFSIFLTHTLSLFFYFVLPALVNFFNLRSFLGFSGGLGLGLITAITHVIVKKPPSSSPPTNTHAPDDVRVFHDINGLASCTESLRFENFDQSGLGKVKINDQDSCWRNTAAEGPPYWNKMGNCVRKEVKSFPPPLSSLNLKGQPSFFLRPVRKDGRLELTEVRIHRPDILHVSRHDGRLTLHLIPDESILDDLEDDVVEEKEEEITELEGELEEEIVETITKEEEEEEEEEEEFGFGEWKFRMRGNEGLRRCHEVVNDHRRHVHGSHHHHHHDNHPLHMCGVGIV